MEDNKEIKQNGLSKTFLVIICLILGIGCCVIGSVVGKWYADKEDNIVEDYTKDEKVIKLYSLYNKEANMAAYDVSDFLEFKEETITASNMSNQLKNFYGYLYKIENYKQEIVDCTNSTYSTLKDGDWASCLNEDYTWIYVFDGKYLENAVKELFGEYKAETFYIGDCSRFFFDTKSGKYIQQDKACGGVDPNYASKLESAYKENNTLVMNVLFSSEYLKEDEVKDSEYDYIFKYTFDIVDNNYIFKSLEKTLRK